MFEKLRKLQDKDEGGEVPEAKVEQNDSAEEARVESGASIENPVHDSANVMKVDLAAVEAAAGELELEEEDTGVNPYDNQRAA